MLRKWWRRNAVSEKALIGLAVLAYWVRWHELSGWFLDQATGKLDAELGDRLSRELKESWQ